MKWAACLLALVLLSVASCGSAQGSTTFCAGASTQAAIDPVLWAQLNEALQQQLAARSGSATPGIDGLYVECTWFHFSYDNEDDVFWTYYNPGDYDQNSEVNIADLVPVGINFGYTPSYQQWSKAQFADGDTNGEVNIADVTPIGLHFGNRVLKYTIEGFHIAHNRWEYVGEQSFEDGIPSASFPGRYFSFYLRDYVLGGAYSDFRVCTVGE